MFLTGISNERERELRTADYYNNLRKRIKLNTEYEEAINASVDRAVSGITKPPPPEENLERDLNDLNLQKQKAFESIKTILTKHDEATKFLGKLDDSEMIPFNRYFARFKKTTTGIEVRDADFLIKLWDTFKKKILLTDKETPILGTELEDYKRELQTKADDIVEFASELGLSGERVKGALDKMVNESDSAAIDKFYYNLLTKGTPAAAMVLKEDFGAVSERPEEPGPILTEEVVPEAMLSQIDTNLAALDKERQALFEPIKALAERQTIFQQAMDFGPKKVDPRILDITKRADQKIIKLHLPMYVARFKKINKEMNDYLISRGSEGRIPEDDLIKDVAVDDALQSLLPKLEMTVPAPEVVLTSPIARPPEEPEPFEIMSSKKEKALVQRKKEAKFDFDILNERDFNLLVELMDADKQQTYNIILSSHPDGKFEMDGIKYNMNRNPPLLEKQKEYVLKILYGVKISPQTLFNQLKASNRYLISEEEKAAEMKEEAVKSEELRRIEQAIEQDAMDLLNAAEKKTFLDNLQNEAQEVANEAFTQFKLAEQSIIGPIIRGIKERIYKAADKSGFKNVQLSDEDIKGAISGNPAVAVTNFMKLVTDPLEPDLARMEDGFEHYRQFANKVNRMQEELSEAKTNKEAAKIRMKLSPVVAELNTTKEFLDKNEKFYSTTRAAIDNLRQNMGPLAEYMQTLSQEVADRKREELERTTQPLEDRYDTIRAKLINEGINTPFFSQAIETIKAASEAPKVKAPRSRNIIGVRKKKPSKLKVTKKPANPQFVESNAQRKERIKREAQDKESMRRVVPPADEKDEEERANMYASLVDEPVGEGVVDKKRKDRLAKIKFGKYSISGKGLASGILDIRTGCNRTSSKLGRTPISSRLQKAINYLIKNEDIDVDLFEALSDEEKKLLLYAIEVSEIKLNSIPFNVFKRFSVADANKELDALIDRYHLLVGELGAGNNAPEILRELRGILFKLLEKKKIDRVYANELLLMINAVA